MYIDKLLHEPKAHQQNNMYQQMPNSCQEAQAIKHMSNWMCLRNSKCIYFHDLIYFCSLLVSVSAMLPLAKQCAFEEPSVETIAGENVLTWPHVVRPLLFIGIIIPRLCEGVLLFF